MILIVIGLYFKDVNILHIILGIESGYLANICVNCNIVVLKFGTLQYYSIPAILKLLNDNIELSVMFFSTNKQIYKKKYIPRRHYVPEDFSRYKQKSTF